MQQLLDGICSGNGGSGVLSVIGGKHKSDADDLHASSKKSKDNTADHGIVQLSSSIERVSQSLVPAAEISAREQEKKNCKQEAAREEKSCMQQLKSEISSRINLLHDKKQNMELWLREPHIINNQNSIDRTECAMQGINYKIASKIKHHHLLLEMQTRNNKSPNNV